jgi:hypothetical protein
VQTALSLFSQAVNKECRLPGEFEPFEDWTFINPDALPRAPHPLQKRTDFGLLLLGLGCDLS